MCPYSYSRGLLSSVQHCAEWAAGAEGQEPIRKCLRSLGVVFRLAVRSRLLFARATGGQYEESFKRDVRAALNALVALAQHPYREHLAPAQVALMTSWVHVAKEVCVALGPAEAARVSASLLDACASAPPALARARLATASELLRGPLGEHPEARNTILRTACHHLRSHLARRDELAQCADMLGELVTLLWTKEEEGGRGDGGRGEGDADVDALCTTTLPVLVDTVLQLIGGREPCKGPMVAGLLGLMELLKPAHYQRLWGHLAPPPERKPLKDFLMRAFLVFRHLIEQDVFPSDWMVLRVASCKVLLTAMQDLAKPLLERFLGDEPPQFDTQLWSGYIELGVSLVTCSALQPERWAGGGPDRPRMRAAAALQLLAVWSRLGPAQLHLIPGAVGALLEITLVSSLRRAALGALVSLMAAERAASGSARRTEAALVDKLDSLVADNKADDHYRRLFDTVLMERVSTEGWREAGAAFVGCVTRLLERLLDYRAVMQGAEHRDKRMAATVNLLSFYKNEIDRKEMYLRYVYKLHDLHIASDNFVEAGCTLLLYAETLSWDSDAVGVDPEHPDTPEWRRKEAIYNQVLQYFDRGKCWEKGLPLLRELATLYEVRLCDYVRLAHCLRTHATFLDSALTPELRPEPEYFRVGFYGKACPLFVRNKQFVYRGYDYERIGAFTQRLQTQYPSAHILMRNTPPDDTVVQADTQYIQICNVKPVPARRNWPAAAPEQVKRFYACNDVDTFLCDRPLHKPPIDKDNEFKYLVKRFYACNDVDTFLCDRPLHRPPIDKDNKFKSLWIERTTLVTENTLPGILRWSEVISRSVEELTPVEFACETIESTERELRHLISQYTAAPARNINPFSMRLQGTIDANVQGGVTKYQQAFLTPEFTHSASPCEAAAAARLRRLVTSQLAVVDAGLQLHGRLAPDEVKPLHRRLVERFNQLRQNLGPGLNTAPPLGRTRRQLSESIVNTPLPPVPGNEKRSQSIQQSDSYYDEGHLYNKPIYSIDDSIDAQSSLMSHSLPLNSCTRDSSCDDVSCMSQSAPPLPSRPSQPRSPTKPKLNNRDSIDSEVETRRHSRASWSEPGDAPPLPPRVSGDKRSWSEAPPAVPRRSHKQSASPHSERLRESEARDSGVSVDAHAYSNADDHRHHGTLDIILYPVQSVQPQAVGLASLGAAAGERGQGLRRERRRARLQQRRRPSTPRHGPNGRLASLRRDNLHDVLTAASGRGGDAAAHPAQGPRTPQQLRLWASRERRH
ncbi:hypothetical protein JYU34_016862 [Plutella xylostella]|uniref:DOCKER domain-containing protein n=1 Tax=Plutella xylostella TaxID=51655 RepID=A0ABQ7Q7E0_PLUXY|nr:hypothetical protein JYU34_016862 [Plutella xylostella]